MGPDVAGVACEKLLAAKISQSKEKVGGDIEEGCSHVEGKLNVNISKPWSWVSLGHTNISQHKFVSARNGVCVTRNAIAICYHPTKTLH